MSAQSGCSPAGRARYTFQAFDRLASIDANLARIFCSVMLPADRRPSCGSAAIRLDLGLRGRTGTQGLPECGQRAGLPPDRRADCDGSRNLAGIAAGLRSEEHTSEL